MCVFARLYESNLISESDRVPPLRGGLGVGWRGGWVVGEEAVFGPDARERERERKKGLVLLVLSSQMPA